MQGAANFVRMNIRQTDLLPDFLNETPDFRFGPRNVLEELKNIDDHNR